MFAIILSEILDGGGIMKKLNCWEHMKCGREAGGEKVEELGMCPAFDETKLDGTHGGRNAGRACWIVAGTFCGGKVQGTYAEKEGTCLACGFYKLVRAEENENFVLSRVLQDMFAA
jgi:hypothetical protein